MNYKIYHPTGGVINYKGRTDVHTWDYVADVVAETLSEARKRANNDDLHYQEHEVRSTMRGDLIAFEEDGHEYVYIIRTNTFDQVPNEIIHKVDAGMMDDFIHQDL